MTPAAADGGIEAMAADVAAAVQVPDPLFVTIEHGAGQSTLSFAFPAGAPVDLFTLGRIARAHGAVVVSVAGTEGRSKATLLLSRPPPATPVGARTTDSLLARALAALAAWRSPRGEGR